MWGNSEWGGAGWGLSGNNGTPTTEITAVDVVMAWSIEQAANAVFQWRGVEVTAVDVILQSTRVETTAVDVMMGWEVKAGNLTKADVAFHWWIETDHESVVIDVHNPETPIYGAYE